MSIEVRGIYVYQIDENGEELQGELIKIRLSPNKRIFQANSVDKVIVTVNVVDFWETPQPYTGPLTVTVEGEVSVQQAVDGSMVIEITSAAAGIVDVSAEHDAWGMGVLELYAQ